MSRLAAVTTGQPTQGLGAAPTPRPATKPVAAPVRQFASPLEAQRAEAEASGALELDDLAAPAPTSFTSTTSPTSPAIPDSLTPRNQYSSMRAAAIASWLSLEAKEIEVRAYFRKIPVAIGLELLAKMRHQCNLAAETLQSRIDEGNTERCSGCGKTLNEAHKSMWIMQGADVDPDTGIPMPYHFCGPMCVRERNREKMLPKELRDQKRFDGQDIAEVR
jgi:hypothetical protein